MKSAYELAMERLEAEDPSSVAPLTDEQRKEIHELEARYKAKVAEREIFLKKQLEETREKGDLAEAEKIETQLKNERTRLEEELEAEKGKVRNRK